MLESSVEILSIYLSVLSSYKDVIGNFAKPIELNKAVEYLNIWKKPIAELSVSPILHYDYSLKEIGIYWPSSRNLFSFIGDEGQADEVKLFYGSHGPLRASQHL